jgi:hypothetical protein
MKHTVGGDHELRGLGIQVVDIDSAKLGDVVRWHDKLHRVGTCPKGQECFACSRLGKHLDPIDLEKNELEAALERYWDTEDESPTPLVKALTVFFKKLVGDELMTYGLLGQKPSSLGRSWVTPVASSLTHDEARRSGGICGVCGERPTWIQCQSKPLVVHGMHDADSFLCGQVAYKQGELQTNNTDLITCPDCLSYLKKAEPHLSETTKIKPDPDMRALTHLNDEGDLVFDKWLREPGPIGAGFRLIHYRAVDPKREK